ncbi:Tetrapyrrole-binding protein, chloroplastic [Apostasia shenzhenica]|uniref:Tetrapyrrole-binding protein, chloroplastic n=1 Tax=Apostasia shenzhenica TaxID=1088818 RepID=A0A2I0AK46_9ASPA|nr:Tetrapyrrole-binding protein, chloroplastic [Apostasia shenzhenica]
MATAAFKSLHHPHLQSRCFRRCRFPPGRMSSSSSIGALYLFCSSTSSTITTITSSSSILTPAAVPQTFTALSDHLSAADFRQADETTRRLLILLAGEAAQKRGYIFFSEIQFIAAGDLQAIDELWRRHSGGRFGYGVQRRIWEEERRDFTRFFVRVGWMRRLETETEQYMYRSFPGEFDWEMESGSPEGHLPLTNALRGTRLLASILTHPAFEAEEEEKFESSKCPTYMNN